MDSSEESWTSESSNDSQDLKNLAEVAVLLRRIKAILSVQSSVVNPPPITKLTGAQWKKLSLDDPTKCIDNLCMSQ